MRRDWSAHIPPINIKLTDYNAICLFLTENEIKDDSIHPIGRKQVNSFYSFQILALKNVSMSMWITNFLKSAVFPTARLCQRVFGITCLEAAVTFLLSAFSDPILSATVSCSLLWPPHIHNLVLSHWYCSYLCMGLLIPTKHQLPIFCGFYLQLSLGDWQMVGAYPVLMNENNEWIRCLAHRAMRSVTRGTNQFISNREEWK